MSAFFGDSKDDMIERMNECSWFWLNKIRPKTMGKGNTIKDNTWEEKKVAWSSQGGQLTVEKVSSPSPHTRQRKVSSRRTKIATATTATFFKWGSALLSTPEYRSSKRRVWKQSYLWNWQAWSDDWFPWYSASQSLHLWNTILARQSLAPSRLFLPDTVTPISLQHPRAEARNVVWMQSVFLPQSWAWT